VIPATASTYNWRALHLDPLLRLSLLGSDPLPQRVRTSRGPRSRQRNNNHLATVFCVINGRLVNCMVQVSGRFRHELRGTMFTFALPLPYPRLYNLARLVYTISSHHSPTSHLLLSPTSITDYPRQHKKARKLGVMTTTARTTGERYLCNCRLRLRLLGSGHRQDGGDVSGSAITSLWQPFFA
jgi:hypothetical protein